jgi:hypothetical protein
MAEISGNVCDVLSKKVIERRHVSFLAKEDIVCHVLNNLCDNHQPSTQAFMRQGYIDGLWRHDSWGDEPVFNIRKNRPG